MTNVELTAAPGVSISGVPPKVKLEETDGEPLESNWHRVCMNLLIEVIQWLFRGRDDFFVGGNMFIYYDEHDVSKRSFRGPDFFFAEGVRHAPLRPYWAVWQEGDRYPDVIVELMSDTTAHIDLTTKKDLYERVFRTFEYYCYEPASQQLVGWRLIDGVYTKLTPDAHGRLECKKLGLWLGTWQGKYSEQGGVYLRFFDVDGKVTPIRAEAEFERAEAAQQHAEAAQQHAEAEHQRAEAAQQHAEAEHQRAEAEHQRAEGAEAELARLQTRLAALENKTTKGGSNQ